MCRILNVAPSGHYYTVLRDAMDSHRLTAPALWECLFDSLPPIHNVKVLVV